MCGEKVRRFVVSECIAADYYAILVDATPDNSHLEQQTFILRYKLDNDDRMITLQYTAGSCAYLSLRYYVRLLSTILFLHSGANM